MKHISFLAILTIFLINLSFAQISSDDFKWLEGTWEMKKEKSTILEQWTQLADTFYEGSSSIKKPNGETKLLESIRIVKRNNEWFYVPTVSGQNKQQPVYFRISDANARKFVAEDATHEFPKRITYELTDPNSIHAWIDDGDDPPGKRSDFYYTRKTK